MKEKLNRRWGLKLLSLLCGFLVWLGVVNVADPIMTDTVEVAVEIVNGDVLEKSGMTYEIVGKKTTTISYEVKTTNAHRIRPTDFRAYADMTELWSVTGAIPVRIEVLNNEQYIVNNPVSRTSAIKIETEPLQRKRFDLNTTLIGELEDNYEPGEISLYPSYLYVEGPESQIGQISSAGIEIPLEGVNADINGTAVPRFYDANGNRIELSNRVESNCDSVNYSMQVLRVKNLLVDFEVSGEVADGYRFTGAECNVTSVPVVGPKSALANLNSITIPAESLNLDGVSENQERIIDLTTLLPEGISLADMEQREATVLLMVEKLEERMYTVVVEDSCYNGKRDEFNYSPIPETLSIRVQALSEELDTFDLTSSDITIDVSDMEPGYNQAIVDVELDPVYELVYVSSLTVNVTEKEEDMEVGPGAVGDTGQADETAETENTENE